MPSYKTLVVRAASTLREATILSDPMAGTTRITSIASLHSHPSFIEENKFEVMLNHALYSALVTA